MKKIIALTLALAISPMVFADISDETPNAVTNTQNEQAETTPKVNVELIVFRYRNRAAVIDQWHNESMIDTNNTVALLPIGEEQTNAPIDYTQLPDDQLSLSKEKNALNNAEDIQVLMHVAWQQEMATKWQTKTVYLNGGLNENEVAGTVKVSQGKFIDFNADFFFTEPTDSLHLPEDKTANLPANLSYHFQQSRRMKLDELNYFDDPQYGILVKITQVAMLPTPQDEKQTS